jgi:hypothetical protein
LRLRWEERLRAIPGLTALEEAAIGQFRAIFQQE